ncbi:Crp/Fnr family transcriptional regulator [Azohydromonas australica]|uniref:Crp/Fnr family transcriptional regulator n=1 Tax=Azohydromonas australica TaxID=364039 RepID=UPI00040E08C0|nr:Crp/Fnr family transcriptional regulator [Azohydromonas australica]
MDLEESTIRHARPAAPVAASSGNALLDLLRRQAPVALLDQAEPVELQAGRLLQARGEPAPWAWFPVDAVASVLSVMRNGQALEVAMVGAEGMVGAEACLAELPAGHDVVVQIPGRAWRVPRETLHQACREEPACHATALQCTLALLAQATQGAACNRLHCIEQQLCRWLLSAAERQRGEELPMTQERLAAALGVRREGVTESARRLQDAGLIRYSRGRIRLTDREGLAARACECYHALRGVSLAGGARSSARAHGACVDSQFK